MDDRIVRFLFKVDVGEEPEGSSSLGETILVDAAADGLAGVFFVEVLREPTVGGWERTEEPRVEWVFLKEEDAVLRVKPGWTVGEVVLCRGVVGALTVPPLLP